MCTGNIEPCFYLSVALHICNIVGYDDAMWFRAGNKVLNQLKVSFLSVGVPDLELDFSALDVDGPFADIESYLFLWRWLKDLIGDSVENGCLSRGRSS